LPPMPRCGSGQPQRSDGVQAIAHALAAGQEFPFMRA